MDRAAVCSRLADQNRGPEVTVEKGTFEQGALVTTNFTAVTSKI